MKPYAQNKARQKYTITNNVISINYKESSSNLSNINFFFLSIENECIKKQALSSALHDFNHNKKPITGYQIINIEIISKITTHKFEFMPNSSYIEIELRT